MTHGLTITSAPRRDRVAADLVGPADVAAERPCGRVEAHRLLEHHRRVGEPLDVRRARRAVAGDARRPRPARAPAPRGRGRAGAARTSARSRWCRAPRAGRSAPGRGSRRRRAPRRRRARRSAGDSRSSPVAPSARRSAIISSHTPRTASCALWARRFAGSGQLRGGGSGLYERSAGVLAEHRERVRDDRHRPLRRRRRTAAGRRSRSVTRDISACRSIVAPSPARVAPVRGERLGLVAHAAPRTGDPLAREQRLDEAALARPALVLAVEQPVAERPAQLAVEAVLLAVVDPPRSPGRGARRRGESTPGCASAARAARPPGVRRRRVRAAPARACRGCRASWRAGRGRRTVLGGSQASCPIGPGRRRGYSRADQRQLRRRAGAA